MTARRVLLLFTIIFVLFTALFANSQSTSQQNLGRLIYFDENLSTPAGQSCASCHHPSAGFADPNTSLPTSRGAIPTRFGSRNSPTTTYSAYIPPLHFVEGGGGGMGSGGGMGGGGGMGDCGTGTMMGGWTGGLFWDGRANTLEDQAKGPFLNPLEMHNPNSRLVVNKLRQSDYSPLFLEVFGLNSFDDVQLAYDNIAAAIAEFERSSELSPFTSKYDYFAEGRAQLTAQEARGLALFEGAAKCSRCHTSTQMGMGGMSMGGNKPSRRRAMFTTFRYENLGLPKNPDNPFYLLPRPLNRAGADHVDLGLGPIVGDPEYNGKFRIPSLRNVALTAPYEHNGIFSTLSELLRFLNTRDVPAAGWPAPEVPETVHRCQGGMPMDGRVLGNLKLTDQQIADIIAFLNTLTDGFVP